MRWYGVRHAVRWGSDREPPYSYEERVTVWGAESFADAVALAEREAAEYESELVSGGEVLGLWQAYEIAQPAEPDGDAAIDPLHRVGGSGVEVFSLIRDSDLPPKEYIDRFFDTGTEHQGKTE